MVHEDRDVGIPRHRPDGRCQKALQALAVCRWAIGVEHEREVKLPRLTAGAYRHLCPPAVSYTYRRRQRLVVATHYPL